ncbi:histidine phosphatase family protein [Nonomuraea sp. B12E4]|uniref:histidine phosphatase family protein n=1 Tax=Nonomuraea sp. B12E4 TaxID=3153564 RepID=UPI00325C63D5
MAVRHLYIARHGDADPSGNLTDTGREQARLLGERLAHLPIDAVWHSPLPRAAASAHELSRHLPDTPVAEAGELTDHVPYVPAPAEMPSAWVPFFGDFDTGEVAAGRKTAEGLIARFATEPDPATRAGDVHEVLVTHAYQVAWLVRHAMDAPHARWLGLNSANTALTVIEYRPGRPPAIVMFNDMSHLPTHLRWTGFPSTPRP